MTPENFIYWLQGYIEIANPETMSKTEIQIIKNHLNLVLKKETPEVNPNPNQTALILSGSKMEPVPNLGFQIDPSIVTKLTC